MIRRRRRPEAWLTLEKALEENLTGEVILSPPTLKTLEDLSRFKTIEEVFHSLKKERHSAHPSYPHEDIRSSPSCFSLGSGI